MDQPDIKPASLIVGNCLSCSGLVRIPAAVRANSTVRCPHCGESFSLRQILENSIPELEVIETESPNKGSNVLYVDRSLHKEQDREQPREKFVVPRQLTIGAKRKRRGRRHGSPGDKKGNATPVRNSQPEQRYPTGLAIGEHVETDIDTNSDWEFRGIQSDSMQPVNVKTAERGISASESRARIGRREVANAGRPKRSSRSESAPIFEIVKIVFGGALAFPIAYLILFWAFRQDPLKLGPTIGNLVPFVVPAELRIQPVEAKKKDDDENDKPIEDKIPKSKQNNRDNILPIPDVDPDKIHVGQNPTR